MKHGSNMVKLLLPVFLFCYLNVVAQDPCAEIKNKFNNGDVEGMLKLAVASGTIHDYSCNNLIGETYLKRGRNDLAKEYFELALSQVRDETPESATCLNNLGLVYWNTGNNTLAKDYISRALRIREEKFGEKHELTAASLNDLGLILSNTHPETALDYYQQALKIYQLNPEKNQEKIAQSKINIGIIFRQLEQYGDAIINFDEALKIWQKLYPEGHPNEAFVHVNLGTTSLVMGRENDAKAYYNKALKIYQQNYGDRHPEIAHIYYLFGNLSHNDSEFDEALNYYQKALIANSPDFSETNPEVNPKSGFFYNQNMLLSTLYAKSQAFMNKSVYKTLNFSELKLSLETLYECDSLIDQIRRHRTSESDKIALGVSATKVYETGVQLCHTMAYESIKKDPYYEQSFYFAEKSKSAVLLEAIADAAAKSFADIPDKELQKEKQITADISYYEQELAKKPGDSVENIYRERLFTLKKNYTQFVANLEKNYPRYYNLKYNVKIPTIADIQKTLDDHTAFISYFMTEGTKRIYVYQITRDKFKVDNIPQPEDFFLFMNGLRNGIKFQVYDLFGLTSQTIFDVLFPSSIPKKIDKLIIVPNGRLGTIPFGALLTEKVKSDTKDYTTLPFLIKNYSISYQYSSALYYQNVLRARGEKFGSLAFLCAPVHFKSLPDLPGTNDEIDNLENVLQSKSVNTDVYVRDKAQESVLKHQDMSKYKYIHFATHGLVFENTPELSRLSLCDNNTGAEDGNLYSGEIYNLRLKSNLVTLSACETGLGKISVGEGIIGLSRAFTYAGANNILVSLWSVADKSTAELMIDFYKAIENENYSSALRTAQLNLINDPEYAKPFYWAPFILIGQ